MVKPTIRKSKGKLRKVEPWIRTFIQDRDLYVLREKRNDKALNVSYSPDGLKLTANKAGKLRYYKNAFFVTDGEIRGDMTPSRSVYIEKFVPKDHTNRSNQIAEFLWIDKAMKLYRLPGGFSAN